MSGFEDRMMDIQASMISLGVEYTQNQVDKIFIYCVSEKELYNFNIFFEKNGKFVKIHKVNDVVTKSVDDSDRMMFSLLHYGNEDIQKLINVCKEYNREHPTEMWLIYDVKKNTLQSKYSYEGRYEIDEELLPRKEFDKWFEEVKAGKDE